MMWITLGSEKTASYLETVLLRGVLRGFCNRAHAIAICRVVEMYFSRHCTTPLIASFCCARMYNSMKFRSIPPLLSTGRNTSY